VNRRTVDDEDVCLAGGCARHVKEVNVVLGEGHSGLVRRAVRSHLEVGPSEGRAVGGLEEAHVKVEELAVEHSVWYMEVGKFSTKRAGGGGKENGNEQKKLVSWSRMMLAAAGSNLPAVVCCVVHDLAAAS
jgi:hypothetical protein